MTAHKFIRVEITDDVMLLELRIRTGILPEYSISKEFEEIRQRRREVGFTKVVFDLGRAPFFGSTLLEMIRLLWNDINSDHGKLVLCNPSAFGLEVLQIAKFDHIWPIMPNRTQAIDLLNPGQNIAAWPPVLQDLITKYDDGPPLLREALEGLSPIQIRTPAPPGAWSALQVVCHIADFEIVYADRLKRVVAEDQPTLFGGDPDVFAAKLAYQQRNVDEELDVIASVRKQTSRFLKTLNPSDFERTGIHSVDGPITLQRLLERISGHIPHHAEFIEGKKRNLNECASDS